MRIEVDKSFVAVMENEIIGHCRDKIAGRKIPKAIRTGDRNTASLAEST
jgi:hypothetical protein